MRALIGQQSCKTHSFYCTGKYLEKWLRHCSRVMAEESHENFSNFDPILERSEGENQNEPKSKPTNENNSANDDGSSKKRRFAVVGSKDRS